MGSETTAAAFGEVGKIRRDPFAMLPFCGYNIGDYFQHWLNFGRGLKHPPPIFKVNWFRRDKEGNYLWPGYGENFRVLKWIVERARSRAKATERSLGWVPGFADFDWRGLKYSEAEFEATMETDRDDWVRELASHDEMFFKLYKRLPKEFPAIRDLEIASVWAAPKKAEA